MPIGFADFLARIGEAGQIASNACANATEKRIRDLCDEREDGKLVPRTCDIELEPGRLVKVPLIALYSPQSMHLQKLTVEFDTEIQLDAAASGLEGQQRSEDVSVTLLTGPSDHTTHVQVQAEFHVSKPHEAVEQLRDRLVRGLTAQLKGE